MVTAAVSCSLPSACLNLQATRASANFRSSKSSVTLGWDPLQRSTVLRNSSIFSSSTSLFLRQRITEKQGRAGKSLLRASSEHESKQLPESENDNRDPTVVQFSEAAKNALNKFLMSAAKPVVIAVMMALLLAQPTEDVLAASSGGRVGGKSFSKPSNPGRAFSGGGGGGRSYPGGIYAAPPIYGSPYGFSPFGFSPFYGGGYGGGLFLGPAIGFGGGGTIILAMIAFATLGAVSRFIRDRFGGRDEDDRFD